MVLAMQQIGGGKTVAGFLGGMLSIGPQLLQNFWTKLEETIGVAQIRLANTVINENIKKEQKLSAIERHGTISLLRFYRCRMEQSQLGKDLQLQILSPYNSWKPFRTCGCLALYVETLWNVV
jgi:hypothetical protein